MKSTETHKFIRLLIASILHKLIIWPNLLQRQMHWARCVWPSIIHIFAGRLNRQHLACACMCGRAPLKTVDSRRVHADTRVPSMHIDSCANGERVSGRNYNQLNWTAIMPFSYTFIGPYLIGDYVPPERPRAIAVTFGRCKAVIRIISEKENTSCNVYRERSAVRLYWVSGGNPVVIKNGSGIGCAQCEAYSQIPFIFMALCTSIAKQMLPRILLKCGWDRRKEKQIRWLPSVRATNAENGLYLGIRMRKNVKIQPNLIGKFCPLFSAFRASTSRRYWSAFTLRSALVGDNTAISGREYVCVVHLFGPRFSAMGHSLDSEQHMLNKTRRNYRLVANISSILLG